MRTVRRSVTIGLVLVLLGAACGGSNDTERGSQPSATTPEQDQGRALVDEGEPVRGGTLVLGLPALTNAGWSPFLDNWETAGHIVGSSVFETLTAYGPDGELVNWLAEGIEPNDDDTVWTVTVRDGITFHDGTPLDGAALAASLHAAMFTGLSAIAFTDMVDDVVESGPRSAEIRFTRPVSVVPELLAGITGYVVAPSMLDDPDGSSHPVGTGPFRFEEWLPDSHFTASAFEDYWRTDDAGQALPYLDEIRFEIMPDPATREAALAAGEVDAIVTTNADQIAAARGDDSIQSVEDNFSEETFVMLNTSVPPFDDPHAREALAYGTDAETVVSVTQNDITIPATSPFAPGTAWEVDDPGYVAYDPERAIAAREAYEADAGQPLSFTFDGIPLSDATEQQQLLADMWDQLGIEANIETLDPVPFVLALTQGSYQAAWFRSYSYTDPLYFYAFFHSKFANGPGVLSPNFSQIHNDRIDALLDEGLHADPERRREIYQEVARELNGELADIWLFHTPWAFLSRPEVQGLNHARTTGIASLEPKPWIGGLWLADG